MAGGVGTLSNGRGFETSELHLQLAFANSSTNSDCDLVWLRGGWMWVSPMEKDNTIKWLTRNRATDN